MFAGIRRARVRERDLPAHAVACSVIALALPMRSSTCEVLRSLREDMQWLLDPLADIQEAGNPGISQTRRRLGAKPNQSLHCRLVGPIAKRRTRGAWRRDWRLVNLDGSPLVVADTEECEEDFGRPGDRCISEAALCGAARERHACAGGGADGGIRHRRTHDGPQCGTCSGQGDDLPGGPFLSRLRALAISGPDRGGLVVAGRPERAAGGRPAAGRWFLPQPDPRLDFRPPQSTQGHCGAGGRPPVAQHTGLRPDPPVNHDGP